MRYLILVIVMSLSQLSATCVAMAEHRAYQQTSSDVYQSAQVVFKARLADLGLEYEQHESVELGMGHVPVLNQGEHGSCATFAITAAIDAASGERRHSSQLCLLTLQRALHMGGNQTATHNAWQGATLDDVFELISHYGIVSKQHEKTAACGGVAQYPQDVVVSESSFFLPFYLGQSTYPRHFQFETLLSRFDAALPSHSTHLIIDEIKTALKNNHRVVISVGFMPGFNSGVLGKTQKPYDTWIITPELKQMILAQEKNHFGFHAVVVTGFYDDALTTTLSGERVSRGVFKCRHSWGEQFGDHGNGYISYEYLQLMLTEAHVLRSS